MSTSQNDPGWERKVLEQLATDGLTEIRRRRRWGIFFRLLGFAYVGLFLIVAFDGSIGKLSDDSKHTALIKMHGVIEPDGDVDAQNVIDSLQAAFEDKGTRGVILSVNSPGGSPVQSGMINDEMVRLRARYPDTPLYVVVGDICASGGYYVASAADRIYVDKASIVGSIGVLMNGFGFTGSMEKLGVERRLLTAGSNKGFLDPFSPQDPRQKEHAQVMLKEIHQQFIDVVRKGRGERLKETPDLFSGLMWSGSRSIELGLADGYGTVSSVARDVIQAEEIYDYTFRQNFAEKFAKQLGVKVASELAQALIKGGTDALSRTWMN